MTSRELRKKLKQAGCLELRQRGSHLVVSCGVPVSDPHSCRRGSWTWTAAGDRAATRTVSGKGLAAQMRRKRFTIRYERDEGDGWVATVKGVGAQTQGRTIQQAQERIREALSVLLDVEPAQLDLRHDIRLPSAARKALGAAAKASTRAKQEAMRADHATRGAAEALIKCGMSLRDAGTLLGISRQRVHQILASTPARKKGAA